MSVIIYVRQTDEISLYEQYNLISDYCKRYGYSISGKVLDFDGTTFHNAINKVVANDDIKGLIIFDQNQLFNSLDDILFYRIYFEKLGKKLVSVY